MVGWLSGKNILLPGEDPAEYERHLDGVFQSLAPQNEAEADITALIADNFWVMDRLERVDKGLVIALRPPTPAAL